jgi:hypothetical protein
MRTSLFGAALIAVAAGCSPTVVKDVEGTSTTGPATGTGGGGASTTGPETARAEEAPRPAAGRRATRTEIPSGSAASSSAS